MIKNMINDVKAPVRRKSIKNIPLPSRGRKTEIVDDIKSETIDLRTETREPKAYQKPEIRYSEPEVDSEIPTKKTQDDDYHNYRNDHDWKETKSKNPILKYSIILASIFILIIIVISIFKTASIEIYAKTFTANNIDLNLPIENTIYAQKDEALDYKEVTLESTAEVKLAADGEKQVEDRASGTITVYNLYSKTDQKLIKNTRFESKDGKIYRISESLTIPGYKEDGGNKTPGTIDVTVYADEPGDKYNSGVSDYTIPGFAGKEQFETMYAKGKTAMTGGYSGVKKTFSDEKLLIAEQELQARLTQNIEKLAEEQISKDFVYFRDPSSFSFSKIEQGEVVGDEVKLKMSGSAKFTVINKKDLSKFLATQLVSDYSNQEILIQDINKLELRLVKEEEELLSVKGEVKFIWQNDEEQIKQFLAGKSQKETSKLLEEFKGITRIEKSKITPFWLNSYPDNANKIKISEIIE